MEADFQKSGEDQEGIKLCSGLFLLPKLKIEIVVLLLSVSDKTQLPHAHNGNVLLYAQQWKAAQTGCRTPPCWRASKFNSRTQWATRNNFEVIPLSVEDVHTHFLLWIFLLFQPSKPSPLTSNWKKLWTSTTTASTAIRRQKICSLSESRHIVHSCLFLPC